MLNVKGQHGRVNKVLTIHGKKNIENCMEKMTKSNSVLAMNKEKADKLYLDTGVQFPQSATIICFGNSIAYSFENVKPLNEVPLGYVQQSHKSPVEKADKHPDKEQGKLSLSEQIDKARAKKLYANKPESIE